MYHDERYISEAGICRNMEGKRGVDEEYGNSTNGSSWENTCGDSETTRTASYTALTALKAESGNGPNRNRERHGKFETACSVKHMQRKTLSAVVNISVWKEMKKGQAGIK